MKEFLLGVIVAAALYLIWKKEHGRYVAKEIFGNVQDMLGGLSSPCSRCSGSVSPASQAALDQTPQGYISPTAGSPYPSAALAPPRTTSGIAVPKPPIRTVFEMPQYDQWGFVAHYRSLATRVN